MDLKKTLKFILLAVVLWTTVAHPVATASTIVIGTDSHFPPYSWVDEQTGKIEGFQAELFQLLKQKLSEQNLTLIANTWNTLINMLEKGEIQAIIGMSITPERKEKFLFTTPFKILRYKLYTTKFVFIRDIGYFQDPPIPIRVGVLEHSSAEAYLKKNFPKLSLREYADLKTALQDMLGGKLDFVMGYEDVVNFILKNNFPYTKRVRIKPVDIELPGGSRFYAIAVNKNYPELRDELDTALTELMEDGSLKKLEEKWFPPYSEITTRSPIEQGMVVLMLVFIIMLTGGLYATLAKLRATQRELQQLRLKNLEMEEQVRELAHTKEELSAMNEQVMAQQEEISFLYEQEKRLKGELEKQNELLSTLFQLLKIPEKPEDFKLHIGALLSKIKDTLGANGIMLLMHQPHTGKLVVNFAEGIPLESRWVPAGACKAFMLGKTVLCKTGESPALAELGITQPMKFLVMPLKSMGEVKGILVLAYNTSTPTDKLEAAQATLEKILPPLAIYLESSSILERHLIEKHRILQTLKFVNSLIKRTPPKQKAFEDVGKFIMNTFDDVWEIELWSGEEVAYRRSKYPISGFSSPNAREYDLETQSGVYAKLKTETPLPEEEKALIELILDILGLLYQEPSTQ